MSSVEPEAGLIGTSTGLQAEECCDQMWGVRGFLGLQKGGQKGAEQTGETRIARSNSMWGVKTDWWACTPGRPSGKRLREGLL